MNDILDNKSTEIQALFYAIEMANAHVNKRLETQQPTLANESFLDNHDVCKLLLISPRTLQDHPAPVLALQ